VAKVEKKKSSIKGRMSSADGHISMVAKGLLFNFEGSSMMDCAPGNWRDSEVVQEILSYKPDTPLFMGIDASFNSTGICLARGSHVACGRIIPGKRNRGNGFEIQANGSSRVVFQQFSVKEILMIARPEYVAIESQAVGRTANMISEHGEFQGVIKSEIWQFFQNSGLGQFTKVAPTQLKLFATGSGKATKEEVCNEIATLFGITFDPKKEDDEADAFILSEICRSSLAGTCTGLNWNHVF
jgi:Holliday junction resolvasome RuvABC endonuclease subunit